MEQKISPTAIITVGEVSKRSGVPISTLHYYENKGLLEPQRSSGNQRLYGRGVFRRVAIIRVAQAAGVPLAEIKMALDPIPYSRRPTAEEWAEVSRRWKESLTDRIEQLTRLRDNLESCIGCGCLTLGECPLRNPDDNLASVGSGPVLLKPGLK